jgi:hypothetical protein
MPYLEAISWLKHVASNNSVLAHIQIMMSYMLVIILVKEITFATWSKNQLCSFFVDLQSSLMLLL